MRVKVGNRSCSYEVLTNSCCPQVRLFVFFVFLVVSTFALPGGRRRLPGRGRKKGRWDFGGRFNLGERGSGVALGRSRASGSVGVIGGWVGSGSGPSWGWGVALWGRRGFVVSLTERGTPCWVLPHFFLKGAPRWVLPIFCIYFNYKV